MFSSFGIEFLEIVIIVPGYSVPKNSVPAADSGLYIIGTNSRSLDLVTSRWHVTRRAQHLSHMV